MTRVIVNMRQSLYGLIRYAPSSLMEKFRAFFFRSMGVNVGENVRFSVGSKMDVWQAGIPGGIGNNVSLGENVVVSGGVKVGNNAFINSNVSIIASPPSNIFIGNDCLIAQNVVIRSDDHRFDAINTLIREQGRVGADITIGDNCWLGANVVVLKGVHLGAHSVVGAGTIVTKSFPAYSVIVGNPGKLIKSRIE